MKQLLIILSLTLLLLAACSTQTQDGAKEETPLHELPTDAQLSFCEVDSDCAPLTSQCHPQRCINSKYADVYEKPQICTAIFVADAAYSADDCACQANKCVNLNQGKSLEVIDGKELEVAYCDPTITDEQPCTREYLPVCGYDANDEQVDTFSNDCTACNDVEVSYYADGEC